MCETAATSGPTQIDRFQAFLSDDDLQNEAVLSHVFGVTRHEARAYRALHNHGETTAQELAERLDRHPSNVYEGLDGLYEIGLATRRRRVPDHGGKEYMFASVPIEDAVQIIRDEFEEWVRQMRDELDSLEAACNG
ncbi:helix-turn-helix domain-containing protein [Halococcus sp. AFM35]|uniref:helix-turn-helix domain-containing protein n=1 Tax=Halococcus sp. AFM35 TaxID=3421653 RepID=UPI003EB9A32B